MILCYKNVTIAATEWRRKNASRRRNGSHNFSLR